MSNILLAIKPEYVENIFNGRKKYEYRKSIPKKKNIEKIIIYATNPVKKVVGEATIKRILIDTPVQIWKETKDGSGTDKKSFEEYYKNKKIAVAFELENIKIYSTLLPLKDFKIKYPPQSFIYLD